MWEYAGEKKIPAKHSKAIPKTPLIANNYSMFHVMDPIDVDRIPEVDAGTGPRPFSCKSSCSCSSRSVQSTNPPQHSDPRLGLMLSRENGGSPMVMALLVVPSANDWLRELSLGM